jgi:anti-sigma regulatory factor (Ser/Thr protein kinase)
VIRNPSPARVRHELAIIGCGRVSDTALEDLMIGVGEAVSNARRHGVPPVTTRIWAGSGRILIHVHDTGPGPADPVAGLVPVWAKPGRRGGGLWLIHMLGLDAALIRSGNGFTIRLAAGHAA